MLGGGAMHHLNDCFTIQRGSAQLEPTTLATRK